MRNRIGSGGVAHIPINADHERHRREAAQRAQEMVFDHAYAEASVENRMRDAVANWRALPASAFTEQLLAGIGDFLCIGIEDELRRRQQR